MQDCGLHLQPEPESGKTVPAVENLPCGTSTKIPHPKHFNSHRPVALTSHLMKTLERLVLVHLCLLVGPFVDPLHFAYQPGIRVDDAIVFLLDRSLSQLEKPGSTVRIMFFDFSSAFNTIQPALLGDRLGLAGVNKYLTSWILRLPH